MTCYDTKLVSEHLGKKLFPMLFFRPNPQATWVAVSVSAFYTLKSKVKLPNGYLGCWFPHIAFDAYNNLGLISCDVSYGRPKPGQKKNVKLVELELDSVIMCPWKDFAANVDPISALV